jgi:hypothetical protein
LQLGLALTIRTHIREHSSVRENQFIRLLLEESRLHPLLNILLLLALSLLATSALFADDLSVRIDSLITAKEAGAELGPVCDDATFARRVYLDLAGRVPCAQETTAFLENAGTDKRTQLIDSLLSSSDYPCRMHDLFHAMLMERRGDHAEWSAFLKSSFAANNPWDQLVREILDPDANQESVRGAAFFQTRRLEKVGQQETDYPGLTRDVGRLFLGMDLQCAQCHNHLKIEHYKQIDFQGLLVVFQNSFIRSDVAFPAIGEKILINKRDFMSVFDKIPLAVGPRVPGRQEFEITTFDKKQEYLVPPDPAKRFPGTPKFRGLELLAKDLPTADNQMFVANLANRLWFVMFGRGLVNPLDEMHPANPPSIPEVLDLLCAEIVTRKFEIKSLLRDLALTQAYQRESLLPDGVESPPKESYRYAREKRLSAEQLMHSARIVTGGTSAAPITDTDLEILRAAYVKAFGNVPQEPEIDFSPSLKSALFVMNDSVVLNALTPQPGNLVDRLSKQTDPAMLVDQLYLSILIRKPTDDEKSIVIDYLANNYDRRAAAVTNLAWALMASTEFCLNH